MSRFFFALIARSLILFETYKATCKILKTQYRPIRLYASVVVFVYMIAMFLLLFNAAQCAMHRGQNWSFKWGQIFHPLSNKVAMFMKWKNCTLTPSDLGTQSMPLRYEIECFIYFECSVVRFF